MRTTRTQTGALKAKTSRFFDDQYPSSSDSDVGEEKPPKGQRPRPSRPAKRPRILENDPETDFVGENNKRTSTRAPSNHPFAIHTVSKSDIPDIRKRLLGWFEGVHDKRGMPWRTRYDASLNKESRAQRAYEVCLSPSSFVRSIMEVRYLLDV